MQYLESQSSIRHWQLSETDRDKYKNQVSYTGFPFFLIDTHVQVGNLNSEQKVLYTFWLRGLSRCHNKKAVPVSYLMITKTSRERCLDSRMIKFRLAFYLSICIQNWVMIKHQTLDLMDKLNKVCDSKCIDIKYLKWECQIFDTE